MKKRIAALTAAVVMMFCVCAPGVFAAQEIPSPDAPYGVTVGQSVVSGPGDSRYTNVYYLVSKKTIEFMTGAVSNQAKYGIEGIKSVFSLQYDYSVNSKDSWTYTGESGKASEASPGEMSVGTGSSIVTTPLFPTGKDAASGYKKYLKDQDGIPALDITNNTFYLRLRFHFTFTTQEGKTIEKYSDWSDTVSFGKGVKSEDLKPAKTLDAPEISSFDSYNPNDIETTVRFTPTLPESVKEEAIKLLVNGKRLLPQAQYKTGNGEWKDITGLDTNFIPCTEVLTVISEFIDVEKNVISIRYRFASNDEGATSSSKWSNTLVFDKNPTTEIESESVTSAETDAVTESGLSLKWALIIAACAILIVIVVVIVVKKASGKKNAKDNDLSNS